MSSHGLVLFSIAARPNSTMRELAVELDLTERRVAQIVRELHEANLLTIRRVGRRNFYSVNSDASFRHPTLSHVQLRDFQRMFIETLPDPVATPV